MFFAYLKDFWNKFIPMVLSELKIGQKAIIKRVLAQERVKERLAELGLIEGQTAFVVRFAPFFDPVEIKVGDVYLAIRKGQADKIVVEKI